MDADESRRFGHHLVEWVADCRERMAGLPVIGQVAPGQIRRALPAAPPAEGGRLAEALSALERDVLPGITHWNHPVYASNQAAC